MSSSNEMPRLPAEDRLETRQLTVAGLAADCAEFADRDQKFQNRDRIISSVHSAWEKKDRTTWKLGFIAMHTYDDQSYAGQSYALQLTVTKMTDRVSNELKQMMHETGLTLPEIENIYSIQVSHAATYIISQYVTLGWVSQREYEILHDQYSLIDGEESEYQDDNEDIENTRSPATIKIGRYLEEYEAPEISQEMELGDSYSDVDSELIECLDTEIHLRQAKDLLTMLESDDESNFDLSTIFPADIL